MSEFKCSEHPTYTGKRLTKRRCKDCFRKYLIENNMSVAELADSGSLSDSNREWFLENFKVSTASLPVNFGIINKQVAEEFDKDYVEPARGQKV